MYRTLLIILAVLQLGAAPRVAVLDDDHDDEYLDGWVRKKGVRCLGTEVGMPVFVPARDLWQAWRTLPTLTPDQILARLVDLGTPRPAVDTPDAWRDACRPFLALDDAVGFVDTPEKRRARFRVLVALAQCSESAGSTLGEPFWMEAPGIRWANLAGAEAARLARVEPRLLDTLSPVERGIVEAGAATYRPVEGFWLDLSPATGDGVWDPDAFEREYEFVVDGDTVDARAAGGRIPTPWTSIDAGLRRIAPGEGGWGPSMRVPPEGDQWGLLAKGRQYETILRSRLASGNTSPDASLATYLALHAPSELIVAVPAGRRVALWAVDDTGALHRRPCESADRSPGSGARAGAPQTDQGSNR